MSAKASFMHTEFWGSGRHLTAILQAENRQKVDKFELVYFGK